MSLHFVNTYLERRRSRSKRRSLSVCSSLRRTSIPEVGSRSPRQKRRASDGYMDSCLRVLHVDAGSGNEFLQNGERLPWRAKVGRSTSRLSNPRSVPISLQQRKWQPRPNTEENWRSLN